MIDMFISQRDRAAVAPEALAGSDLHRAVEFEVTNLLEHLLLEARPLEPEIANAADVETGDHQLGEAGQPASQCWQRFIVVQRDLEGELVLLARPKQFDPS
jgi:hypothetical protein